QRGSADIITDQRQIEIALGNLISRFLAQWIVAVFLRRLAQAVQDLAESPLAGAVAEKALVVLQFDVETVDLDRRQAGGPVAGDARGRYDVFCHVPKPLPDFAGNNGRGTHWFHEGGEWRIANGEWTGIKKAPLRYSPLAIRPFL